MPKKHQPVVPPEEVAADRERGDAEDARALGLVDRRGKLGVVARRFDDAAALIHQRSRPDVLAIDVPIGLTDAGPRACDLEARRLLGQPRGSSVFPAPIRPMLAAKTWEEACRRGREAQGKALTKQAWAILPKIAEVDRVMRGEPRLQRRVHGVHPEVSFCAWAGRPLVSRKRRRAGRAERQRLVEAWLGRGTFARAREQFTRREVGSDDILDAFAALWTAERILRGEAKTLPAEPPVDRHGLRMEIVY